MRIRAGLLAVWGGAAAAQGLTQGVADPRALEACRQDGAAFTEISRCLPPSHVGFAVLDAFAGLYPEAAQVIPARCQERNAGNADAASVCVVEAVRDAIALAAMIGGPEGLDDPVFQAVADPALLDRLVAAREAARALFPDVTMWGGYSYYRYE